jgi:hypothetical protein
MMSWEDVIDMDHIRSQQSAPGISERDFLPKRVETWTGMSKKSISSKVSTSRTTTSRTLLRMLKHY